MANAVRADSLSGRNVYSRYNSGSSAPKTLQQEYIPAAQIGTLETPARRKHAKAQSAVRPAEAVSPLAIIGMVAAAVMAVMILCARIQLNELNNEIVSTGNELAELQTKEDKLDTEYQQLFDMTDIQNDMVAGGKMITPNDSQMIYLELSEPDSAETFESSSLAAKLKNALETVIEFLR